MNEKMEHEKLIKTLRATRPLLNEPEKLTDQIINNLPDRKIADHAGISTGSWAIFICFRAAASVAAILLVGYFAYQQWEMSSKISRLEDVIMNKTSFQSDRDLDSIAKTAYFNDALIQEFMGMAATQNKGPDQIKITRKHLFTFIKAYNRLTQENENLKDRLTKEYKECNYHNL